MNDYLLTFELDKDGPGLHICTDIPGLEELISQLSSLLEWAKKDKTEHIHLMTEEWGGGELSSEPRVGTVINHVKVYCWNKGQVIDSTE